MKVRIDSAYREAGLAWGCASQQFGDVAAVRVPGARTAPRAGAWLLQSSARGDQPVTKPQENAMKAIALSAALGCTLIVGAVAGCYDEEPVRPAPRTGGSTVVVTDPKPGIASPQPVVQQPAPQSSPPIINNVIQPAPNAPPVPAPAPGNNTTVNVP
jgi:hypothetical protein